MLKSTWLAMGVAVAALAMAPTAQALVCDSDVAFTEFSTALDCSGTQNFWSGDSGILEHDPDLDGLFGGNDWVTDLHIEFMELDVEIASAVFTNITAGVSWDAEIMDKKAWFVAPNHAARLNPGDEYQWRVTHSFSSFTPSTTLINIAYTMDVPEPALGLLLLGGVAALATVRRRSA